MLNTIRQNRYQTIFIGLILGLGISASILLAKSPPCAYASSECPVGSTAVYSGSVGVQGGTAFTTALSGTPTGDRTLTLPDATDTLVALATVDTMTNKTLTAPVLQGSVGAGTGLTMPPFTGGGAIAMSTNEISGTSFDIDGGDISSATVSGGLTWTSAQDLNSQALTNANIDSGDISSATISGGLTWTSAQDLNSQALTNANIDSGDISGATISGGLTWTSAQDLNSQALTNANIDSGDISSATISGGLTWSANQDLNNVDLTNVDIDSGAIENSTIVWGSASDLNNVNLTNVDFDSGDISSATISGGLVWSSAQDLNSIDLTNVDFDSGDISSATISGGLTWSANQDLNSVDLTNVDIDSGAVDGVTIGTNSAVTEMHVDNVKIDSTTISTTGTTDLSLNPDGTRVRFFDDVEVNNNQPILMEGSANNFHTFAELDVNENLYVGETDIKKIFFINEANSNNYIPLAILGENYMSNSIDNAICMNSYHLGECGYYGLTLNSDSGNGMYVKYANDGAYGVVISNRQSSGNIYASNILLLGARDDTNGYASSFFKTVSDCTSTALGSPCDVEHNMTYDGRMYRDSSAQTPADWAEYMYTDYPETLSEAGTLVCIAGDNKVKRCDNPSEVLLGVISHKAGVIGVYAEEVVETAMEYEENPHWVVVGIMGQVPVKTSSVSGLISAGDLLRVGYEGRALRGDSPVTLTMIALESQTSYGLGFIRVLIK